MSSWQFMLEMDGVLLGHRHGSGAYDQEGDPLIHPVGLSERTITDFHFKDPFIATSSDLFYRSGREHYLGVANRDQHIFAAWDADGSEKYHWKRSGCAPNFVYTNVQHGIVLHQHVPEHEVAGDDIAQQHWFSGYVSQTVRHIETCFTKGAQLVQLVAIMGDIHMGQFTLKEWPALNQAIENGMASGQIHGATWENLQQSRMSIDQFENDIEVLAAPGRWVIVASTPAVHMDRVRDIVAKFPNVVDSFARSGDMNC